MNTDAPLLIVDQPFGIPFDVPITWHHPLDDGVPLGVVDFNVSEESKPLTADFVAREAWGKRRDWSVHGERCMCDSCTTRKSADLGGGWTAYRNERAWRREWLDLMGIDDEEDLF